MLGIILKYLLVFFFIFFIDILWVIYIKSVETNKKVLASNCNALILFLGVLSIFQIFDNRYMLILYVLGGWLGTYVGFLIKK